MSKQDLEDYPLPDIDCLYLDMNGIIYKCSKVTFSLTQDDSIIFRDQVMSRKAEEIWFSIFNYINSIVDMIKPRKLLFLGLDGVAPRAKMNNQRARRFRSAKDYKELERKLEYFGDAKNEEEFKNNCITPGTEFMSELNKQLRFFIAKKI
jgi:5'-3' exoribonuclease 1